jgi:hypothetical protein
MKHWSLGALHTLQILWPAALTFKTSSHESKLSCLQLVLEERVWMIQGNKKMFKSSLESVDK